MWRFPWANWLGSYSNYLCIGAHLCHDQELKGSLTDGVPSEPGICRWLIAERSPYDQCVIDAHHWCLAHKSLAALGEDGIASCHHMWNNTKTFLMLCRLSHGKMLWAPINDNGQLQVIDWCSERDSWNMVYIGSTGLWAGCRRSYGRSRPACDIREFRQHEVISYPSHGQVWLDPGYALAWQVRCLD